MSIMAMCQVHIIDFVLGPTKCKVSGQVCSFGGRRQHSTAGNRQSGSGFGDNQYGLSKVSSAFASVACSLPAHTNTSTFSRETVRKKAYVALYWQLEIDPQLQDQLLPILEKGLVDKDPSVLGAVIGIWRSLIKVSNGICLMPWHSILTYRPCQKSPALYEEALPAIINHLKYILGGKLHKSFDYHGTPSPWVQMHCIEILEIVQSAGLG
jgi:hypothetical protein